jgi:Putative Flp pilus-assembly TadE/G-like
MKQPLRSLLRDEQGSILILAGLSAMVMIAFMGLATDVAILYAQRQGMQNAADAAALGAARAYAAGNSTGYVTEGRGNAAVTGYVHGRGGISVAVTMPPTQGAFAGRAGYVEALVSQNVAPTFLTLLLPADWQTTVTAAAVATTATSAAGQYCVLALDPLAANAAVLENNAYLPNSKCGLAANSTNPNGLYLNNNATIAGPVAVGGSAYHVSNNAAINGAVSKGSPMVDPYAGVTAPSPPACTNQASSGTNNISVNLTPGHFCSGLNFTNNATVTLAPGTYYVDSQFAFSNNAVFDATGVTIILNGNFAMNIGNNAIITLSAPTSGPLAGIALMGPRNGSTATNQVFSNNTTLNVKGALYFPSQKVEMDNNATSDANGCVQLIAQQVYFSNNANLPSNCTGSGTTPIGPAVTFSLVQ